MARERKYAKDWSVSRVILIALLLFGLLVSPAAALGADHSGEEAWFVGVDRSGDSIVQVENGTAYVWKSETHRVNVTFRANRSGVTYSVCPFTVEGEREGRSLMSCQVFTRVNNGSTMRSSFKVPNENVSEGHLVIVLRRTFGDDQTPIDRRVLKYEVIERDGDFDGDGLTNQEELDSKWDLDFTSADTDGDGIDDRLETREYAPRYGVDPTKNDTDGDGFSDKAEIGSTNATDPDDYPGKRTPTPTVNQSVPPTAPDEPQRTGVMAMVLAGLLGVTGIGVVVIWFHYAGDDGDDDIGAPAAGSDRDPPDGGAPPHAGEGSPYPDPLPEHEPRRMPEDDLLLTDEDRVYNLVRGNGGRMKQATIVKETDWSKSKVSRLLSRMEEQGDINKLRVGRGNIIYFDGAEPPAARNPFDEADAD